MSYFNDHPITNETPVADNLFEPLPEGVYTLTCVTAEEKKTRGGDDMLALRFQVEDSKRQLFANFMLTHAKQQTVQIAQGQLKSLCERAGIPLPLKDSQQLIGATITTKVKVVPRHDKPGEFQNEIVFSRPTSEQAQASKARMGGASPTAMTTGPKKDDAPW